MYGILLYIFRSKSELDFHVRTGRYRHSHRHRNENIALHDRLNDGVRRAILMLLERGSGGEKIIMKLKGT